MSIMWRFTVASANSHPSSAFLFNNLFAKSLFLALLPFHGMKGQIFFITCRLRLLSDLTLYDTNTGMWATWLHVVEKMNTGAFWDSPPRLTHCVYSNHKWGERSWMRVIKEVAKEADRTWGLNVARRSQDVWIIEITYNQTFTFISELI